MVIKPEIDVLLSKVDSRFTLCILAARRARQINDMLHGVRDQAILSMSPVQIASLTSFKPLSSALNEIADGEISYVRAQDSYK